jgi:2-hydroxychromene-2-carboxylate isomerase
VAAALYAHFFVEHRPIKEDGDFMPVLEQVLGKELAAKVHDAAPTEGKKQLEANTAAAVEEGAFGMPWFVTQGPNGKRECFWGVDHLGQVVDALGLERPESSWRSLL